MSTNKKKIENDGVSMARAIAPEDVRPRMYVALLHEVERSSCSWCDSEDEWWRSRGKRMELSLPWDVEPQRVKAVCVPFILVETTKGEVETIDTRRYRLAQLPEQYGRVAFAKLRRERAKEKNEAEPKGESARSEGR